MLIEPIELGNPFPHALLNGNGYNQKQGNIVNDVPQNS
jgi:hypothetical protein